MNFGIETLASWPTLLFCLGVYVIVFLIRRTAETVTKGALHSNYYWREVVLHLLPPVVGLALAIAVKEFPYPEGLAHWNARALYGLVGGFASGLVYKIAMSIVRKLWPGVLPSASGEE